MKILLIGEYSGVHSTLAHALRGFGHQVTLCSDGDSYKNFSRDITIKSKNVNGKFSVLLRLVNEFFGTKGLYLYFKNRTVINRFSNYDVVQIINPVALDCFGSVANFLLLKKILKKNTSLFMCALGDDTQWVNACLSKSFKYSPLDRLSIRNFHRYLYSLKYIYGLFFSSLNSLCLENSKKIIPGLIDYKLAYKNNSKCTEVVPIPILKRLFSPPQPTTYPVKIFHGWQEGKELKKGNDIFHNVVLKLQDELGSSLVSYKIVKSVPFDTYQDLFNESDIILDQCFSYGCGVNALLGLASGKVVFSGFEIPNHNWGDGVVGVNAIPDADYLYSKLKSLVLNLDKINEIKDSAYRYALKFHDEKEIARIYIEIWSESE